MAKVCIAHLGSDLAHKDHKFTGSSRTEQEVGYQGAYFSENQLRHLTQFKGHLKGANKNLSSATILKQWKEN